MMFYNSSEIQSIIDQRHHRPYDMPAKSWKYYQEWNRAVFVHLKVDRSHIEKYIPPQLSLETLNGVCYISIVLFTMENVQPRHLPSLAYISNFHEINIRTYVCHNGKSGVYFLNIEGEKTLSCFVSKALSGLNYKRSAMKRTSGLYTAENSLDGSDARIEYEVMDRRNKKSESDKWLTERYCMYNDVRGRLYRYDIHHLEWPLNEIEVKNMMFSYPQLDLYIDNTFDEAIFHYSPGIKVVAWEKEFI